MKKILLTLALVFALSINAFSQDENKDNPGYLKGIGFAGVYGFLANYTYDGFQDNGIGGGAFIYFIPVNTIYGNMIIGVGSSFNKTFFRTDKNMNGKFLGSNYTNIPIQLNIGYSTSSDFINVWGGAGFTYNYTDLHYRSIKAEDGTLYGLDIHDIQHLAGIDLFVGFEYLLTKNKMLGLFAEGRYSFIENMIVSKDFPDTPQINIRGKALPWVLRIAIGLNIHF